MKDKVLFRFWTITDYEEEEQFLTEQHRAGWKLRRYILPGFYIFDRCMPQEVSYRLDFDQAGYGEKAEYLQLYRDYGWEYLFDVNGFSYFRKPAGAEEEDMEIFSDNESRIEMVSRVFKYRMIPLLLIFFICVIPQICIQSFFWVERGSVYARGFTIAFSILAFLYLCLFVHCGKKIHRLRKKYQKK